ncbi:MAG: CoA-binding protein [Bacteroidota bacterium]|nr:CoA-binding protein [Bacteroidota bacterium]
MSKISAKDIESFCKLESYAIIGVSKNPKKFGNIVYTKLKEKGYNVVPVNPNAQNIGNDKCYKNIKNIPCKSDGIIILTKPHNTSGIIKDAIDIGIKNIWIQQKSESDEALEIAFRNNINPIFGQCILMYMLPKGIHLLHRKIKSFFGQMPK